MDQNFARDFTLSSKEKSNLKILTYADVASNKHEELVDNIRSCDDCKLTCFGGCDDSCANACEKGNCAASCDGSCYERYSGCTDCSGAAYTSPKKVIPEWK